MDLKRLVERVNPTCFKALERAAERSRAQGHWFVEPEHLFAELLTGENNDLLCCLREASIPVDTLSAEIERTLAKFKSGCTRMPVFSVQLVELLEGAVLACVFQGLPKIRSALLLLTLLQRERLRANAVEGMPVLLTLPEHKLASQWPRWCETSGEESAGGKDEPEAENNVLYNYTLDLTRDAREGKIDPIIGRDAEIRQCIDIPRTPPAPFPVHRRRPDYRSVSACADVRPVAR